jgi:hypothetical protein
MKPAKNNKRCSNRCSFFLSPIVDVISFKHYFFLVSLIFHLPKSSLVLCVAFEKPQLLPGVTPGLSPGNRRNICPFCIPHELSLVKNPGSESNDFFIVIIEELSLECHTFGFLRPVGKLTKEITVSHQPPATQHTAHAHSTH